METARKIREPHYTLDLTSRKIILNLEDVRLTEWIRACGISLSVPYLKYPFDYSSGLDAFRNQLTRVESLSISVDFDGLADAINGFQNETRIYSIKFRGGGAIIVCNTSGAAFTAKLDLLTSEWNEVILNVRDIRSYSAENVSPVGAVRKMIDAFQGGLVSEKGATFIKLKPLNEIVTNLFPFHGFKIPICDGLRIVRAGFDRDGIKLIFLPESIVYKDESADSWRLKAAGEDFA
ncbi:MAG: hypothetical protein FJ088_15695, partial [Deltaproteobacteria bacterium]|nr:hypothetical protein [Deltaproteobacteria bacterium]